MIALKKLKAMTSLDTLAAEISIAIVWDMHAYQSEVCSAAKAGWKTSEMYTSHEST